MALYNRVLLLRQDIQNITNLRHKGFQLLNDTMHTTMKYRICACISSTRVQAAPRFLGQEFRNNKNSYVSRTRFFLCESKIFAIAFAALWLSLAAFTVICQWCHVFRLLGIDNVGYSHVIKICRYTGNTLAHSRVCNSLQDKSQTLVVSTRSFTTYHTGLVVKRT
jgi:hypothetical protein